MDIAGHTVEKVLVEQQANIAHELYVAILNDPDSKGPLIMFSDMGGMDIEEIAETQPQHLVNVPVSITEGPDNTQLAAAIEPLIAANKDIGGDAKAMTQDIVSMLNRLYKVYDENDAELLEINPLAILDDNSLVALDCKFVMDDSSLVRQSELSASGTPEKLTGRAVSYTHLTLPTNREV